MWWGTGSPYGNVTFQMVQPRCQVCTHPDNVVLKRGAVEKMLKDARVLTHPDHNAHPKAQEVTARLNACLAEIKRPPR